MGEAVARLSSAITNHEKIAIYGDYDADGVTATALMVQVLTALGANVEGYIPNRFDEVYGLNNEALDNLKERRVNLIVTVDCGVRSLSEAKHAKRLGMDLIITDHHQPEAPVGHCVGVQLGLEDARDGVQTAGDGEEGKGTQNRHVGMAWDPIRLRNDGVY